MRKLIRKTTLSLGAVAALLLTFGSSQPASAQTPEPYLGQLMLVGFKYCPKGWLEANGRVLPIVQNEALFSLFGTTYGGDGTTTFNLPDLRGRYPMGEGTGPGLSARVQGQKAGLETMKFPPQHAHGAVSNAILEATSAIANVSEPGNTVLLANGRGTDLYANGNADRILRADAVTVATVVEPSGITESNNNMTPYLVLRWCVAIKGIFPPMP